jgi:hypothetical protein
MKKLLEVGDRVKLVNAIYIDTFLGVTGTVHQVSDEVSPSGGYQVLFYLSEEDRVRLSRAPGFFISTLSTNLKYLKPKKEKNKAAKLDEKFARKLDKLGGITMLGTATKRETELVMALSLAVAALDTLTYESAEDVTMGKIKKAMLEEL